MVWAYSSVSLLLVIGAFFVPILESAPLFAAAITFAILAIAFKDK